MAKKEDKIKTLAGKRKLEKPDLEVIQRTYGKKVVMPNGQVLRSTWYTPPKLEKERQPGAMGPSTFTEHVRRSKKDAPKTVSEATDSSLRRGDVTYEAYMRAMRESGKTPTSAKSINWGSYERGRDYTVDDLKQIQSAEGKKVVMPNGKVLQSTWYRPPALDAKLLPEEENRLRKNEAVYRKQMESRAAAPANAQPETIHSAMQATKPAALAQPAGPSVRDQITAMKKPELVRLAKELHKELGAVRADGRQNFNQMSRQALARIIRQQAPGDRPMSTDAKFMAAFDRAFDRGGVAANSPASNAAATDWRESERQRIADGTKRVGDTAKDRSAQPEAKPAMIGTGQRMRSQSGREIVAPKIASGSDMQARNTLKRMDAWLHTEALAEAKATRNDYLETLLKGINPKRMSPADRDMVNIALFGSERATDRNLITDPTPPKGKPAGWSDEARAASAVLRAKAGAIDKSVVDAVEQRLGAMNAKEIDAAFRKVYTPKERTSRTSTAEKRTSLLGAQMAGRDVAGVIGANPLSGNKKTMAMVEKAPKGSGRKGARVAGEFKPDNVNPYEAVVKQAQGQRSVTMEQVAGSGLRGTQNPENLKAIIANREALAKLSMPQLKALAKEAGVKMARSKAAMVESLSQRVTPVSKAEAAGKPVKKIRTDTTLVESAKSASITIPDMSGQKPDKTPWQKLVAETEAAQKARMAAGGTAPERRGADTSKPTDYQKSLDQTGKRQTAYQGDPGAEGKPTAKSRAQLIREAKGKIPGAEKMETRTLAKRLGYSLKYALPVGIAAGALIAMNQSAEAGESSGKQVLEGAKAAGTGAAVAAGFIGGSALAVKGLMRAGLAVTPAGWAVQGVLMAGGAAYGAITAKPGERLKAAAKGAWDMSLPGGLVNTGIAIKEAATSTKARMAAGPTRLTPEQQVAYAAAAKQKVAQLAANRADAAADKSPGWTNAARIAAAEARGAVVLPYGGDPSKGPQQWAPASTTGITEAMRKRS